MESVNFKVKGERFIITREAILTAMDRYDQQYRSHAHDAGRRYAIRYRDKLYPPKYVLSLAINRPRTSFSGGKGQNATNTVFANLGFEIVSANTNQPSVSTRNVPGSPAKTNIPIPDIEALIQELLSKKWTNLHSNYIHQPDGEYPGVYILAYSDKPLEGEQVQEQDIFYVGMTHAGIVRRLGQFIRGLEEGGHHSGANRFFNDYARQIPYNQLPKKRFFVASIAIPCVVDKQARTPLDLRKMGEVTRLEYYVLAHIKERLGVEPELNKK
jgi:hypothetical protein